jgi:hypothetical protein
LRCRGQSCRPFRPFSPFRSSRCRRSRAGLSGLFYLVDGRAVAGSHPSLFGYFRRFASWTPKRGPGC